MKKRVLALFIAVIMMLSSACVFISCKADNSSNDQTEIVDPIDPPDDPVYPPDDPVDPPDDPVNPPEGPINPPESGSKFEGNLPSNPNREDSYEAK